MGGSWTLIGHWRLPDPYFDKYVGYDDEGRPRHFRMKTIPKIWYFTVNAGAVFFLPFLGIFWRTDLGYTTSQVGILQAVRPWVAAASGNVLMQVADIWQIHYWMLLGTYSVGITSRGLMTIGWEFPIMMVLAVLMEAAISPMGILVDATVVTGSAKKGTYGRARLWASVGWGCFAPLAGWVLSKYGIKLCFKIFATIYAAAFIPTALIPAQILSVSSRQQPTVKAKTSVNINATAVELSTEKCNVGTVQSEEKAGSCMEVVVVDQGTARDNQSSTLQQRRSSHHHHVSVTASVDLPSNPTPQLAAQKDGKCFIESNGTGPVLPIWKETLTLLSNVSVMTFMCKALLMGVCNGFIGYVFLLLNDQGASGLLLGMCLTANCVGEVPVFYFSGKLIEKLGVEWSLHIAAVAYLVRLFAYAMIPWYPSLWLVIPVEVLQGLTFGLAWSAGTVHCRDIAPPHLRSSVQSVYSGLYTGVGAGIGGLAGGLLYDAYGGRVMSLSGAGIMGIGWMICSCIDYIAQTIRYIMHELY